VIDAALRADIAARVRLERPVPGRRRATAAMIAREFEGRAPRITLIDAVRDARAAATGGAEVQDPAAPALMRPHDMLECTGRKMRLTRAGCYRLWLGSKEAEPMPWEGRAACVGCATGARNAGYAPSLVARLVRELRHTCSRCRHPTSRLINDRFCISCYNRHAEALRGRNARGSRPKLCEFLLSVAVARVAGPDVALVVEHKVTSATETMLVAARKALAPVGFGWAPRGPGDMVDLS
jgi:hypothetical protein